MTKKAKTVRIIATLPKLKPVTIADVKTFIKESRVCYGLEQLWPTTEDLWETGSTHQLVEAGRQEGRDEVLKELAEYLKRGN